MSKKLILLVCALCLLSVSVGFLLGVKMTSVPKYQSSNLSSENSDSRSNRNMSSRQEPKLLRFEEGGGYSYPEKPSLPFETYGLDDSAVCVVHSVSGGKADLGSTKFGRALFLENDPRLGLPQRLVDEKVLRDGDVITMYWGSLRQPSEKEKEGLRIVITRDRKSETTEEVQNAIDKCLPAYGYAGYKKVPFEKDTAYFWNK